MQRQGRQFKAMAARINPTKAPLPRGHWSKTDLTRILWPLLVRERPLGGRSRLTTAEGDPTSKMQHGPRHLQSAGQVFNKCNGATTGVSLADKTEPVRGHEGITFGSWDKAIAVVIIHRILEPVEAIWILLARTFPGLLQTNVNVRATNWRDQPLQAGLYRRKPKGDGGKGTAKTKVTTICNKRHDN